MENEIELRKMYESYDILVLCANDIEYKAIYNRIAHYTGVAKMETVNIEGQSITFGLLSGKKVSLVKLADTGVLKENSILPTLMRLSNALTISSIFMVGVCAGIKDTSSIGDVVVSNEIISYSVGKMRDGLFGRYHFINRGQRFYPGNIYKTVDTILAKCQFDFKVEKGKVLSADILLDSKKLKAVLIKYYPEAVALEMEGVGLALSSSILNHNNWLLIKGVSDKGAKKKGSQNQERAVGNALIVLEKILEDHNFTLYDKNNHKESTTDVLISGSFVDTHPLANDAETFSYKLSQELVKSNFKVITGYGLVIGPAVVAGTYDMAKKQHYALSKCLSTFPFPRLNNKEIQDNLQMIKSDNRMAMTKSIRYAIFIYGYKDNSPNNIAEGMKEELYYTHQNNAVCIPVASTGFTAKMLWEIVKKEWEIYHPKANERIKMLYEQLASKSDEEAIEVVLDIIREYEKISDSQSNNY